MARSPTNDRLLPPLMYIFRDANAARDAKKRVDLRNDEGARVLSGRRGMTRKPVSEPVLRREVNTNLTNIFNTTNLESIEDLTATPLVKNSILNFGIPSLSAITIDENKVNDVTGYLKDAIMRFEPRIIPHTIETKRDRSVDEAELTVRFNISGQLRCEPLDIPVEFIAEVEGDTGKFRIERL